MKNYILTPGPTPIPDFVREALSRPIIHHRTPQFQQILKEAMEGLKYIFQTEETVYIISSSGTGAMEAAVANVASPGVLVGVEGRWMYEKRLSLGAELNYQYNPAKQNFWDVGRRGDVTAHYQTVSLLFRGDYYFSHKEVRPYTGVAFGGFFMFNDLMFASTLPEYIDDESVSYTTTLWKPGFAPEGGVVFKLNRKTFLDLNFKFIFIPNIEPEYETEIINGWPVVINKNPHANQHHLQLSATLLFGI